MTEGKVYVKVKDPMLSIDICEEHGYEVNNALWEAKHNHEQHGGSPIVVGVVTYLGGSQRSKLIPTYKIEFPDGHHDYIRIDKFDTFFEFFV